VIQCLFCREDVESQDYLPGDEAIDPLYPVAPWDVVHNWMHLRQSDRLLLHHGCRSRRMDRDEEPYWDAATGWWACKETSRPVDEFIHFDLGCGECAVRWHGVRDQLPPPRSLP
jgi:hypothetical protein